MERRKTPLLLALVSVLSLACGGCLLLAGAAVGAGVVAATSEDTAQVDVHGTQEAVFKSAQRLLEEQGNVTSSDARSGEVQGSVGGSSVEIHVFPLDEMIRVRITARKLGGTLPDLDLAKRLATDISHRH